MTTNLSITQSESIELLTLAEEAAQQGDLNKAEELGHQILQQDGSSSDANNLLGFISYSRGRLNEAQMFFEAAYHANTDNIDAGKNLADIYNKLGQTKNAKQVYATLLKTAPNDPELQEITATITSNSAIAPVAKNSTQTTFTGRITFGQPKTKSKVTLVVCLFEDNFGDKLIYNTIDKKLRDRGFETEAVEISQSLTQSQLIEKANSSNFLYFVGGGIIERYAPEVIINFDSVYKRLRVPHGVVGLSTGSFDYSDFGYPMKLFCDTASFFHTRDEESVQAFQTVGATRPPTAGVDVVFANDTLAKISRTGNNISASFRNVPYIDITGDLNWNEWSAALQRVGVKSLIPDCSNSQTQLGLPINPDPILRQISESGTVIAMRYHVVLTAAMMGVLPIPISYCPKVERLAAQLGLQDYCLSINDHYKLESTVERLLANENTVRKNMMKKVNELKQRAESIVNDSINVLEQNVR